MLISNTMFEDFVTIATKNMEESRNLGYVAMKSSMRVDYARSVM